jgi:hypothetical protein
VVAVVVGVPWRCCCCCCEFGAISFTTLPPTDELERTRDVDVEDGGRRDGGRRDVDGGRGASVGKAGGARTPAADMAA